MNTWHIIKGTNLSKTMLFFNSFNLLVQNVLDGELFQHIRFFKNLFPDHWGTVKGNKRAFQTVNITTDLPDTRFWNLCVSV